MDLPADNSEQKSNIVLFLLVHKPAKMWFYYFVCYWELKLPDFVSRFSVAKQGVAKQVAFRF